MNTKEIAHEVRLRQWGENMHQRQVSGLPINKWCEAQGIRRQQYFYWQRKLREAACAGLAAREGTLKGELIPNGWTQLSVAAPESARAVLTIEINGCRVEVRAETDRELLAKVCRTLKAL